MAVAAQIGETWTWCLVPEQPDPMGEIEWNEVRLAGGEGLASRASKKLVNEELLLPCSDLPGSGWSSTGRSGGTGITSG